MGFYETLALFVVLATTIFIIGLWVGKSMADQEWHEIIDFIKQNPNATRDDLDLIFRLDRRNK